MIIFPSLPSGHVTFCDDIRHEITGKATLVGVYGSQMYVSNLPAVIPKLCVAIVYREAIETIGKVVLRVLQEQSGSEEILTQLEYEIPPEFTLPQNPDEAFQFREAKFTLEIAPLNVDGPSALKVRAYKDDDEIRLGTLRIDPMPLDAELSET